MNAHNPLLDDDDDEFVGAANPLLDDDEDEYAHAQPIETSSEPTVSQPLINDAQARGTGTRTPSVTKKNARDIAHIAAGGISNVKAMQQLQFAEVSPIDGNGGKVLRSPITVYKRLEKLVKMGCLKSKDIPGAERIYSATSRGVAMAQRWGYLLDDGSVANKTVDSYGSLEYLNHDLAVSHVAAQLASPKGYFRESLKLAPKAHDEILMDFQVGHGYEEVKKQLTERAMQGGVEERFGEWRARTIKDAERLVEEGRITWKELTELYPAFWALGHAQNIPGQGFVHNVKFPDIVISREAMRTSKVSASIAVEVELKRKTLSYYERTLRTYALDFKRPLVYSRVVYFTNDVKIKNLLKKADDLSGFGLIASGRLLFMPITQNDGVTPLVFVDKI